LFKHCRRLSRDHISLRQTFKFPQNMAKECKIGSNVDISQIDDSITPMAMCFIRT